MKTKLLLPALTALTALLATSITPAFADAVEDAMTKAGCMACHTKDKKLVGPPFKEIAAKYKGQDVTAKLMAKVRAGGSGTCRNSGIRSIERWFPMMATASAPTNAPPTAPSRAPRPGAERRKPKAEGRKPKRRGP